MDDAVSESKRAADLASRAAAQDRSYSDLTDAYLELSDEMTYFRSALDAFGWNASLWTDDQHQQLRDHITNRTTAEHTIRAKCAVLSAN